MKFSPEQIAIINEHDSSLVVSASPGSGKTTTIIERARKVALLKEKYKKIALITYTNAGADEIIYRSKFGSDVFVGTIHSFCLEFILRPYRWALESKSCKIISYDERKLFFENNPDIILDRGFGKNKFKELGKIRHNLDGSLCKDVDWDHEISIDEVAERYESYLQTLDIIDFEQILIKSYQLLNENNFIAKSLSALFYEIMVDEFQDTDHFQYEILKSINESGNCSFTFVGDQKQRIFGFAGAIKEAFEKVKNNFNAVPLELTNVFRSTDSIVECYCKLFDDHPKMTNLSESKDLNDHSIEYLITNNSNYRVNLIHVIENLLQSGYSINEIAILSTSWFESFSTSKILRERFQVCGQGALPHPSSGDSTYQLIRSILRFIHESTSLRFQIIGRNFDVFCLENDLAYDEFGKIKIINSLVVNIDKIDNELSLNESFVNLTNIIEDVFDVCCSSFTELLESINNEEIPYWNFNKYKSAIVNLEGIRNDTIHKVKGLEFDVVILNKMNENKIPRQKLLDRKDWVYEELTEEDIEEARTVFYVACSRPRKKLIINHNWKPSLFVEMIR